jgi:hypothetical protein
MVALWWLLLILGLAMATPTSASPCNSTCTSDDMIDAAPELAPDQLAGWLSAEGGVRHSLGLDVVGLMSASPALFIDLPAIPPPEGGEDFRNWLDDDWLP